MLSTLRKPSPTRAASVAIALSAIVIACCSQANANQFANPSFEDPITYDGPPFVGSWEGFSGGAAGTSTLVSTVMPRTGASHIDLTLGGPNSFAGVFQDVPVTGGSTWSFMGWHKAVGSNTNVGPEVRIEWRDDTSEIGRTPNLVPALTSDYTMFNLVATAPAGATIARAVYAGQTFSTGGSGTLFIDDFSFKVPEPGSVLLAGIGLIGVVRFARRRRA
ncbi:MAG: PEP-CTERM sorting domain-containing protein [Pirellulales bacterium]|nr:PEP-CTERM sorting domain-containing protein [Pirellulales bacterium]